MAESNATVCNATNVTPFRSCWNFTLLCALESPSPPFLPILQSLVLSFYFVIGLSLNGFLVFVVLRYEELRKREFALALQVVAADLMLVICFFPAVIITSPTGLWSLLGPTWCSLLGFVEVLFSSFRYTSMFLLAFDRFNMVFFTFVYPSHGNKIMIALTTVVWVMSLLLAIIPLGIQCYGFRVLNGLCTLSSNCSKACSMYRPFLDFILYTAGGISPIIFYSLMFLKSRQMNNQITAVGSDSLVDESNKRARRTFLLLFVSLMGCALPHIIGLILSPLKSTRYAEAYRAYSGISATFLYTVVILDPLVIMKHQDVTSCVLKLLQSLKKEFRGMLPVATIHVITPAPASK